MDDDAEKEEDRPPSVSVKSPVQVSTITWGVDADTSGETMLTVCTARDRASRSCTLKDASDPDTAVKSPVPLASEELASANGCTDTSTVKGEPAMCTPAAEVTARLHLPA